MKPYVAVSCIAVYQWRLWRAAGVGSLSGCQLNPYAPCTGYNHALRWRLAQVNRLRTDLITKIHVQG